MNFSDAQLQRCYDRNLLESADLPDDLRQVRALIATHDLFQMLEGPHSSRVHETLECLVSGALRPALGSWYQRCAEVNSVTTEFREELSRVTGERLEIPDGDASPT